MTPVREQDADTVAIDIYRRVDKTGERITLGTGRWTGERLIGELRSHRPHCRCGQRDIRGEGADLHSRTLWVTDRSYQISELLQILPTPNC